MWISVSLAKTAALFIVAGLLEIAGGYLVWLWLREDRPLPTGWPARCCWPCSAWP